MRLAELSELRIRRELLRKHRLLHDSVIEDGEGVPEPGAMDYPFPLGVQKKVEPFPINNSKSAS